MVYGSKFGFGDLLIIPDTLGKVYSSIILKYGKDSLNKPRPGVIYVKRTKALNNMDLPAFKELPKEIKVLSPARLFRSKAWKYNGRFYKDCEVYWQFNYSFIGNLGSSINDRWMSVSILSLAYERKPALSKKYIQQTLF